MTAPGSRRSNSATSSKSPVRPRHDEVARATRIRRDDRHPRGQRLLHRLAERLVLARMHEHVHARIRSGKLGAVERSGENRCGQDLLELAAVDAVADDHQLHIIAQRRKPLDMLLRR